MMIPERHREGKDRRVRPSPGKSFLLALPMMVLTFIMMSGGRIPSDPQRLFVFAVTYLFFNVLFFLMIHTGKTDRYRATAFITYLPAVRRFLHLPYVRGAGKHVPQPRRRSSCARCRSATW